MTFLGWKLSTGEVVRYFEGTKDEIGDIIEGTNFLPGEHEANKLRSALKYKGRMTPQYA